MMLKTVLPTIALLLFAMQPAASQTSLSREEAASQIKAALDSDPIAIHFYLELAYDKSVDTTKILQIVTGPTLSEADERLQINRNGSIFDDLYVLYHLGVIDHFELSRNQKPQAVLKDTYKWFCKPQLETEPN